MENQKNVTEKSKIDVELSELPQYLFEPVKQLLTLKKYNERIIAREKIISMGKDVLPYFHKLASSDNGDLRKLATKIIVYNASEKSILVLINLLNDDRSGIRWLASEGLIKIGRDVIIPLLKFIRDMGSTYFQRLGAHHVLISLLSTEEKKEFHTLILSLYNYLELGETASHEASKALKLIQMKFKDNFRDI